MAADGMTSLHPPVLPAMMSGRPCSSPATLGATRRSLLSATLDSRPHTAQPPIHGPRGFAPRWSATRDRISMIPVLPAHLLQKNIRERALASAAKPPPKKHVILQIGSGSRTSLSTGRERSLSRVDRGESEEDDATRRKSTCQSQVVRRSVVAAISARPRAPPPVKWRVPDPELNYKPGAAVKVSSMLIDDRHVAAMGRILHADSHAHGVALKVCKLSGFRDGASSPVKSHRLRPNTATLLDYVGFNSGFEASLQASRRHAEAQDCKLRRLSTFRRRISGVDTSGAAAPAREAVGDTFAADMVGDDPAATLVACGEEWGGEDEETLPSRHGVDEVEPESEAARPSNHEASAVEPETESAYVREH